jgi:hypothetical protein
MRRFVMAVALFGAAALAAGGLAADEPKKAEKNEPKGAKKDIGKMMKERHHGEKSAQVRTAAELKKDAPDWDEIAKNAKAFTEMGAAFKGADLGYASPKEYITSAAALTKAVSEKDKKTATEAFTGLTKSCSACHYYGGPGGTIR